MNASMATPPKPVLKVCGLGTSAEKNACRATCTVDTCSLLISYWSYRPNIPINAIFGAISLLLAVAVVVQGWRTKQFKMYTFTCFVGSIMTVIGYAARLHAYWFPFNDSTFVIQLSCLTFAPAFFAAAIYFSLSRIVDIIGPTNSRIKPKFIPRIFITCDVISLFLQAAGGAISAWRASKQLMPDPGNYTLIAGLSFQSLTLLVFGGLAVDFALHTKRRMKKYGTSVLNDDIAAKRIRESRLFKWLVWSLAISAFLIFVRSVYRIAELSQGWKGELMKTEKYVVIWESVPVAIAGALLCLVHPGFCFRVANNRNSDMPTREECYRMESTTTSGISSFSMPKGGQVDVKTLEIMYDDGDSSRGSKRFSPPDNHGQQYLHSETGHNRF